MKGVNVSEIVGMSLEGEYGLVREEWERRFYKKEEVKGGCG